MFTLTKQNVLIVLSGIMLLAFFLRLHHAGKYGIYFDEKSTLLISQGVCLEGANQKDVFTKKYFTPQEFWAPKTIADFVEANIRGDIGNSPSYYAVLWAWMEVFGLSDLSMRLPSVLFSTLTILLLFVFVRRHFKSDSLALVSSGLAAIEPFFVAYSQMARNYSMSFFLTLLATHLFLLIMERVKQSPQQKPVGLYLGYGVVFALSVLSHYLTVTVFLCHGIYALFYLRNRNAWLTLAATAVIGLGLVSLWFIFGGGKYTFQTLAYQAKFYKNIAETNPLGSPFGMILPATIPNIAKRAIPIFADLFIFTNGLGGALIGLRNSALALLLGGAFTFLLHRSMNARTQQQPVWLQVAPTLVLLAGLPVYSVVPLRFLVLSAAVPIVYLITYYILTKTDTRQKRRVLRLILLTFVPTFFLLFMAWRSGHTFGITQRYSGFSFPYVCILIAMGLKQLMTVPRGFSLPVAAVLAVQLFFVAELLGHIYAGEQGKYTYFEKPRIENPYWYSAKQLEQQYAQGDTILYPNMKRMIYDEKIDKTYSPVALLDAQLVNVYLPENATYIQRIDPDERDKIVLVKGNTGQKITIFDLKNVRY
nr:glycosyltransferase family 39 protein [uncultured Arsenicibacter sp.]